MYFFNSGCVFLCHECRNRLASDCLAGFAFQNPLSHTSKILYYLIKSHVIYDNGPVCLKLFSSVPLTPQGSNVTTYFYITLLILSQRIGSKSFLKCTIGYWSSCFQSFAIELHTSSSICLIFC